MCGLSTLGKWFEEDSAASEPIGSTDCRPAEHVAVHPELPEAGKHKQKNFLRKPPKLFSKSRQTALAVMGGGATAVMASVSWPVVAVGGAAAACSYWLPSAYGGDTVRSVAEFGVKVAKKGQKVAGELDREHGIGQGLKSIGPSLTSKKVTAESKPLPQDWHMLHQTQAQYFGSDVDNDDMTSPHSSTFNA